MRTSVTRRLRAVGILLAWRSSPAGARRARRSARARRRCAPATSTKPSPRTAGPCRPIRGTRTTRSRCSARWSPPRGPTSSARRSSKTAISSRPRSANTAWRRNTTRATGSCIVKVAALDQTIRERIEAARPRPAIEELRAQARAASAEPALNPASREPLNVQFPNAQVRDVLGFIANATGINITYDRDVADRPADLHSARRRHARAGAQSDHDDEAAVVQGRQRAIDLRLSGYARRSTITTSRSSGRSTFRTPIPPSCRRRSASSFGFRASPCSR